MPKGSSSYSWAAASVELQSDLVNPVAISYFKLNAAAGGAGLTASGKAITTLGLVGSGGVVAVPTGTAVVIFVTINGASTTVQKITDTGGNTYVFQNAVNNGTTVRTECWATILTTSFIANAYNPIVTLNASATAAAVAEGYSGVGSLGQTHTHTGSSSTPNDSITIAKANNWVVSGLGWQGTATFSSAVFGTPRTTGSTSGGGAASNCAVLSSDNTSAVIASVENESNISASSTWAAASVELVIAAAVALIWNMPFLPGFGNGR